MTSRSPSYSRHPCPKYEIRVLRPLRKHSCTSPMSALAPLSSSLRAAPVRCERSPPGPRLRLFRSTAVGGCQGPVNWLQVHSLGRGKLSTLSRGAEAAYVKYGNGACRLDCVSGAGSSAEGAWVKRGAANVQIYLLSARVAYIGRNVIICRASLVCPGMGASCAQFPTPGWFAAT
jgi:hypothetical protein